MSLSNRSRLTCVLTLLAALVAGTAHLRAAPRNPKPPNILIVLVDDLGWTDLGCMGSDFYETPNIDRLASQGMRFTQAYAACTVCSPTRAALLTGKYPARIRITDWIEGHKQPQARLSVPDWTLQLPLDETTLAEALKPAGYATGHIGKWHLGREAFRPDKQGFDVTVGGDHRGQPPSYFAPYNIPTLDEGPRGEYLTDREAAEAIRFIERTKDAPFLLYLPHYAVHTPLQAKADLIEKYKAKAGTRSGHAQRNAVYAAMIESLDTAVGRILAKLEELELAERTVVFFTSDNGGLTLGRPLPVTSNSPLRMGKGSSYEGGVRVPLIVRWPGVVKPGTVCDVPVITMDCYPTVLSLAGVGEGSLKPVDGHDLLPLLKQEAGFTREAIFWHYPHYHPGGATPYGAMRQGNLKLIEFYESGRLELYDLQKDAGETNNLANQDPRQAIDLRQKLHQWLDSVGAQMPAVNPDFKPDKTPLPSYATSPSADGSIVLHARDVTIHGATVRYEPQPHKNTVGYWTQPADWISWEFQVLQSGRYSVELLQGCGPGNGGSDIAVTVGGQTLEAQVLETRGFQDFVARDIGTVTLDVAGVHTLSVKPRNKTKAAVMDLRRVVLKPMAP